MTLDVRVELDSGAFSLDVSFEVPAGVTVLFGPSGAGKTRTLHAIAGLVKPRRGRVALGSEIWFDDRTHVDRPIEERRVAVVFQSLALFPHMTARENVAFGIDVRLPREVRVREAEAMLARMRVGHLALRLPSTFSGGESQRVALARAFAMKPRALLLDEPFSALDDDVKRVLLEETARWVEQAAIPTVLVTHDEAEARAVGRRTVHLAHGRVVEPRGGLDARS